jgi:glutamyl-Q tRNA(Asp) synthetase
MDYTGRFAPSPSGPLHAGSMVAALASWLDARAHHGRWLVRIEDVDQQRCIPGMDRVILGQLAACGLHSDDAPLVQSQRGRIYRDALDQLLAQHKAYPCACSRKDIEQALSEAGQVHARHGERIYPGTCRQGLRGAPARAWRLRTDAGAHGGRPLRIDWVDRRTGPQEQDVETAVGDFVLLRADGEWAYQLAVVVDDAAQGVTHVVRGEDLSDNTARQIWLQHCLGLPTPAYLHTPLVMAGDGHKLSKQNGARAVSTEAPLQTLADAAMHLGLPPPASGDTDCGQVLATWTASWQARWVGQPLVAATEQSPPSPVPEGVESRPERLHFPYT